MCCDEDEIWEGESCFERISWETVSIYLGLISLILAVTCICWLGYITHAKHKQDRHIGRIEDPYREFETYIKADIQEEYTISAYAKVNGNRMSDHAPRGVLLPKVGPMFETAQCKHTLNSPYATMHMIRQFQLDLRNMSKKEQLITYDSVEIRFEIPWGNKVTPYRNRHNSGGDYQENHPQVQSPGSDSRIHYIYDPVSGTLIVDPDSLSNSDGTSGTNDPISNSHIVKARCPTPYCPSNGASVVLDNCYSTQNPYKDPYSNVGFEFTPMTNYLRKIETKEVSTPVHCGSEVGRVETRVRCSCSGESPPRFLCKFPITDLIGKIDYYRLDIGFEYPVSLSK